MVGDVVEDNIFACASGEIVDGLEDLVGDAVEFEGGVEGDDGVVAKSEGHAITVERQSGERSGIDSICYESDAALDFQAMEQIQDGAIARILLIPLACFPERKQGR